MTRKEVFNQLCDRMNSPANKERYNQWENHPDKIKGDYLIAMHLKHIRDYIEILKDELHPEHRKLIEISCDSALQTLERLLDKNNWEK